MMEVEAQSYMGKRTILKGIGKLYGGLWCLFPRGVDLSSQRVGRIAVSRPVCQFLEQDRQTTYGAENRHNVLPDVDEAADEDTAAIGSPELSAAHKIVLQLRAAGPILETASIAPLRLQ